MDFELDTKAASSYGRGSQFISEAGAYVGELVRAADVVSTQQTKGVDLMFRSAEGQVADYITIWHTRQDGTHLPGWDAINALMTCLKIRGARLGRHHTEKWVKEKKQYEKVELPGYPDFCKKPIGIVLQGTLELKGNSNEERHGLQIVGWFEPNSRLTASEILGKVSQPKALDSQLEWLAKNPVKDQRKRSGSSSSAPSSAHSRSATPAGNSFADFDDDIPF